MNAQQPSQHMKDLTAYRKRLQRDQDKYRPETYARLLAGVEKSIETLKAVEGSK